MTEIFDQNYAFIYDYIYHDKKYSKEVSNIVKILERNKIKNINKLDFLDYGCGTGKHLLHLSKYSQNLHGYDKSRQMINIAKKNDTNNLIKFYSIRKMLEKSEKKFDIIIMLFDVFSYFTEYNEIHAELSLINNLLKKGGILIFQFWYGPSVLYLKPKNYKKKLKIKNKVIFRECNANLDINGNLVNINYRFRESNQKIIFSEKHKVRYFFRDEVNLLLATNNFTLLNFYSLSNINKKLSPSNEYSVTCLAKKKN